MKKAPDNTKLLRGIVYENLYKLQEGMCEYRKTRDKGSLKECFQRSFGTIIVCAQRTGSTEIANFCQSILDICELTRWSNREACLDVFRLINKSLDWMLVHSDPELDTYYSDTRQDITAHAPYEMLTGIKRRLEADARAATSSMHPAACCAY